MSIKVLTVTSFHTSLTLDFFTKDEAVNFDKTLTVAPFNENAPRNSTK